MAKASRPRHPNKEIFFNWLVERDKAEGLRLVKFKFQIDKSD